MTTKTQHATAAATVPAQASPSDVLPVFAKRDAPSHLRTETQLKADRLKVGPDQQAHALMRIYRRGTGWTEVPLYHPDEAQKMRPLSTKQQAQKLARRTCRGCGQIQDRPISSNDWPRHWPGKPEGHCAECLAELHRQWSHTCSFCDTTYEATWLDGRPCPSCEDRRQRAWNVVNRLLSRHCPTCLAQTATHADIKAAGEARRAHLYPLTCTPCQGAETTRREEARRAAERERWDELGPVRTWARQVIAAPHEYAVIDTETTGLAADAALVEIGITDGAGNVLLETLVNPGRPIPQEAADIHGITDEDVCDAPSFSAILPRITAALKGRRVIIYNQEFDTGVLAYELDRHHRVHTPALPGAAAWSPSERHPATVEWMAAQEWDRCAMLAYAVHVGDWSDYWGDWRWPRLQGGHRALGDCRAVVDRIQEMAETLDPF
ncbi:exonuclease domain-containing protein [Streptomyces microflavus]